MAEPLELEVRSTGDDCYRTKVSSEHTDLVFLAFSTDCVEFLYRLSLVVAVVDTLDLITVLDESHEDSWCLTRGIKETLLVSGRIGGGRSRVRGGSLYCVTEHASTVDIGHVVTL
jgi:hypothetical protein